MSAVPMLPAGPNDCEQRLEYLNGRGGIELKTGRIDEGDWARKTAKTVKSWGGPVTWHVPEQWTARIGFPDFNVQSLVEQVSIAEPLLSDQLIDALVFHCGSLRWLDAFDPKEDFKQRYTSHFTSQEILDQIERHVDRFGSLVNHFGQDRLLIENTPLSLWYEVMQPDSSGKSVLTGLENFLGPFVGTLETVLYLSRMTGAGVVLDTGHLNDFLSLMELIVSSPIEFGEDRFGGDKDLDVDKRLFNIAGYWNSKGKQPFIHIAGEKEFSWYIRHCHFRLFHIDACRGSFFDGKPDCERPILTEEDAKRICLKEIIQVARANPDCLGMLVENVGSDVWPFATERPTDWEGKRRTFEFLETAINNQA